MRTSWWNQLLGLCCVTAACQALGAEPWRVPPIEVGPGIAQVQAPAGAVEGYRQAGVEVYRGVPYAQAERFMAPVRVARWETPRSSRAWGAVCPVGPIRTPVDEGEFSLNHRWGYEQEAHCLNLNIWTPAQRGAAPRPVMVWLHGGGFAEGSSQELPSYDGTPLARQQGVVVVSVNHRLNVLGYLDLSAYGPQFRDSSNAGMLDLVAALQWVRDNIAAFGGDPANVTVFGESGGASKVHTLMAMPAARGLFHKAVMQSSFLPRLLPQDVKRRVTREVLAELGLSAEQAAQLQGLPYERLRVAGEAALKRVNDQLIAEGQPAGLLTRLTWAPGLDGLHLPQPFDAPETVALSAHVPLLIGTTKNEFASFMMPPALRYADAATVEALLQRRYGADVAAFKAAHAAAYPQDRRPSDLLDVDADFRALALAVAARRAEAGTAPVYLYLFDWEAPMFDRRFKAGHIIDVPFVFNTIHLTAEMTGATPAAYALGRQVSTAWAGFARSGRPAAPGLPAWPAFEPRRRATLVLRGDNASVVRPAHDDALQALMQRHPVPAQP